MGNSARKQALENLGNAISQGDEAAVQSFLQKMEISRQPGADRDRELAAWRTLDLNELALNDKTPLQAAALSGHASIVRLLIDGARQSPHLNDIDVDILDNRKMTALHHSCSMRAGHQCAQIVADLLFRKANPCIAAADGCTPLDLARKANCQQCVRTLEDKVKLWQGWVDYDEKKAFGLPSWQPRWLVVLRDRHPNTGLMGSYASISVSCYQCRKVLTVPCYCFQMRCRCGADVGIVPSLQLALYTSASTVADSVLPDTARPSLMLHVPQIQNGIRVEKLEDASWKSATEALFSLKVRKFLQNTPGTERRIGFCARFMKGTAVGAEHSFRVSSEADRTLLMDILGNPVKAAYDAWWADQQGVPLYPPPQTATAPGSGLPPPAPMAAIASSAAAAAAPAADTAQAFLMPDAARLASTNTVPDALPSNDTDPQKMSCAERMAAEEAAEAAAAASGSQQVPTVVAGKAPPASGASRAASSSTMVLPPCDPSEETTNEAEACVVCLAKKADTAVVPCGHLCGCETCLRTMQMTSGGGSALCPMCRGPMTSIIRIYRS